MELFVCIKNVPDDTVAVTLNGEGKPELSEITSIVNPFDTYALEMATRFKEAHTGAVTVLTVGNEAAVTPALRSCLSVGADKATVYEYESCSDAANAAELLAAAVSKVSETLPDVIFCGSESTDNADSQVGVRLAQLLGLPVVVNVLELTPSEHGLSVKQETDNGYRMIDVALPCVVTVVKPDYEPRYPSIKSKMAARKMPIAKLDSSNAPASKSKTQVLEFIAPAKRQAGTKIVEKEAVESVRRAMEMLTARKLV